MKKLIFVAIASVMVLVSCSKDQRTVNKMEGTWELDKIVYANANGSITDNDPEGTYTFNKCKLRKDDWCTGSFNYTSNDVTFSDNFEYRITNDGETVELRDDADDNTYDIYTVLDIDKKKVLTVETSDSDDESSTTIYLTM